MILTTCWSDEIKISTRDYISWLKLWEIYLRGIQEIRVKALGVKYLRAGRSYFFTPQH